ncbi:DUF2471 family protein [Burkholderia orbicola]|uniref:DUF2471 family protein n=1 Tax=Burkholderia orbicola TaxID=2978683 RepID=UPI002FE28517
MAGFDTTGRRIISTPLWKVQQPFRRPVSNPTQCASSTRSRATEDLRCIATSLADRHLTAGLTPPWTWPVLLEIEEQAFSDLAFQSRNEAAVVDALPRMSPATFPGVDLSGLIDWTLADASLPILYLSVRERLSAADPSDRAQAAA